jgi:signal transduction histidine kinase
MTQKIHRSFLLHYGLMLLLSAIIGLIAFAALDFANSILSSVLVKNRYPAQALLQADYRQIDTAGVMENGGGVQVINNQYEIVLSRGLNIFQKGVLTPGEFTNFLTGSRAVGVPYSHDIAYSQEGRYWLIVTFPTSLRIDFSLARNTVYPSKDMQAVIGAIIATVILYLLLLSLAAVASSRLTALTITKPLQKLCQSTRQLQEGDYAARVDLKLKNEFSELQNTFNDMAQKLQEETALREQAEKSRRQLVLDISHDLKNPLAAILGYAEYGLKHPDEPADAQQTYLTAIRDNGQRANTLITGLFELSKLESPEYRLQKSRTDLSEYLRLTSAQHIAGLDSAGFTYDFDIPEEEAWIQIDENAMGRVFQNLFGNALQYNTPGTKITLSLTIKENALEICFRDNGIGMAEELAQSIFQPFVRADASRNSKTGGTGLGLAIVRQIITLHGGSVSLKTSLQQGCAFYITLPKA